VIELSEGWTGHLIREQWLFVGLEGVMVVVAAAVLNIFHPAFCFKDGLGGVRESRSLWFFKKQRQGGDNIEAKKSAGLESGSGNDSVVDGRLV